MLKLTNLASAVFGADEKLVLHAGDCLELLASIPDGAIQLIVTSPPYNLGKVYEKKLKLDTYLSQQEKIVRECVRILSPSGSLCWQVGNFVDKGEIVPLDIVLFPIFSGLGLKLSRPLRQGRGPDHHSRSPRRRARSGSLGLA